MIKFIKIFFTIIIISTDVSANNIAVINIENIINNNPYFQTIMEKLELNKQKYFIIFEEQEKKLDKIYNEIETSKILLNQDEINVMIDEYNYKLSKFQELVDNFNLFHQNQITELKKVIVEETIVLVEKYANDNNIDIVLESNNYLLASNAINITNIIDTKLKKIELKLDYKDFEEN